MPSLDAITNMDNTMPPDEAMSRDLQRQRDHAQKQVAALERQIDMHRRIALACSAALEQLGAVPQACEPCSADEWGPAAPTNGGPSEYPDLRRY
jgi:hypothetical protein